MGADRLEGKNGFEPQSEIRDRVFELALKLSSDEPNPSPIGIDAEAHDISIVREIRQVIKGISQEPALTKPDEFTTR